VGARPTKGVEGRADRICRSTAVHKQPRLRETEDRKPAKGKKQLVPFCERGGGLEKSPQTHEEQHEEEPEDSNDPSRKGQIKKGTVERDKIRKASQGNGDPQETTPLYYFI